MCLLYKIRFNILCIKIDVAFVEAELEIAISQVILSVQEFQREIQAVFFHFSSTVPKMSMGVLFDLLKMLLARLV